MRLFADEQHRHGAVAPEAEVEGEAADHADDGVHHFRGQTGDLHHGHGLPVRLEAEQVGQDVAHRVAADIGVFEHEGVARVGAQVLDPRQQPMVVHAHRAVFKLAPSARRSD